MESYEFMVVHAFVFFFASIMVGFCINKLLIAEHFTKAVTWFQKWARMFIRKGHRQVCYVDDWDPERHELRKSRALGTADPRRPGRVKNTGENLGSWTCTIHYSVNVAEVDLVEICHMMDDDTEEGKEETQERDASMMFIQQRKASTGQEISLNVNLVFRRARWYFQDLLAAIPMSLVVQKLMTQVQSHQGSAQRFGLTLGSILAKNLKSLAAKGIEKIDNSQVIRTENGKSPREDETIFRSYFQVMALKSCGPLPCSLRMWSQSKYFTLPWNTMYSSTSTLAASHFAWFLAR